MYTAFGDKPTNLYFETCSYRIFFLRTSLVKLNLEECHLIYIFECFSPIKGQTVRNGTVLTVNLRAVDSWVARDVIIL